MLQRLTTAIFFAVAAGSALATPSGNENIGEHGSQDSGISGAQHLKRESDENYCRSMCGYDSNEVQDEGCVIDCIQAALVEPRTSGAGRTSMPKRQDDLEDYCEDQCDHLEDDDDFDDCVDDCIYYYSSSKTMRRTSSESPESKSRQRKRQDLNVDGESGLNLDADLDTDLGDLPESGGGGVDVDHDQDDKRKREPRDLIDRQTQDSKRQDDEKYCIDECILAYGNRDCVLDCLGFIDDGTWKSRNLEQREFEA